MSSPQEGVVVTHGALATLLSFLECRRFLGSDQRQSVLTAHQAGRTAEADKLDRQAWTEFGGSNLRLAEILAIAQAICAYRERAKINGPLFIGIDTHA